MNNDNNMEEQKAPHQRAIAPIDNYNQSRESTIIIEQLDESESLSINKSIEIPKIDNSKLCQELFPVEDSIKKTPMPKLTDESKQSSSSTGTVIKKDSMSVDIAELQLKIKSDNVRPRLENIPSNTPTSTNDQPKKAMYNYCACIAVSIAWAVSMGLTGATIAYFKTRNFLITAAVAVICLIVGGFIGKCVFTRCSSHHHETPRSPELSI